MIKHKWVYEPFSTHHGWEPPEYRCSICGDTFKGDDPPNGDCSDKAQLTALRTLLAKVKPVVEAVLDNAYSKESIPESNDVWWVCNLCHQEIGLGERGTEDEAESHKDWCVVSKLQALLPEIEQALGKERGDGTH